MQHTAPRMTIAGLSGDSGKTLVSLGVVRALRGRGMRVAGFKKGPDFIDAAWLAVASGAPGRNLDTFLMSQEAIRGSLARWTQDADIAVVEGNRGLFDGVDARGTHSTAQLAKVIASPVILVVDVTKVTGTVAAMALGCRALDPELPLAGVVLNRVATARHERVIREALAAVEVPVLGAIPRLDDLQLPSRHLGLVTASEHPAAEAIVEALGGVIAQYVDLDSLVAVASSAGALAAELTDSVTVPRRVRVGVLADPAFTFYYPENLEALEAAGAELVRFSPLTDGKLPDVDALYAGGGFPELYAEQLTANTSLRSQLARKIAAGLPVWAECGGLMYLSDRLIVDGVEHAMVGALPLTISFTSRPQGHGYVVAKVEGVNPFISQSTSLKGHEFHYSQVLEAPADLVTALTLQRGIGIGGGRDGVLHRSVFASYTHFHALGTPEWAPGLVREAAGGSW